MQYINIFVYGTLKKGYRNHAYFCQNVTNIIPCTIKGTMYDTGYGYPAIQLKGDYTIYGELITVPKDDLIHFDYLQGHPNFYQRQLIDVNIGNVIHKAYVYTMQKLPDNAVLMKDGNW